MSKRTDLKSISKILDTEPVISPKMMSFAHWISQYYIYPLGEVLFSMLPSFLRKGSHFNVRFKSLGTERS